jgi:hypothetical protein
MLLCNAALIDGEVIIQDKNCISEFDVLRSAIHSTDKQSPICGNGSRLTGKKARSSGFAEVSLPPAVALQAGHD